MESNSVCNHTGRESLMTSMITDRIWRHEVLLPINQNYIKICDIFSFFKIKTQDFLFRKFLPAVKKKTKKQSSARVQWRVLSNYLAKGKIMEVCQRASQVNPISIVMIIAVKVKKVFFFESNVMLYQ